MLEKLNHIPNVEEKRIWVITHLYWIPVFIIASSVFSIIPFFIGFFLGLSVAHDAVFGTYALIGGIMTEFIIRKKFRIVLLVWRDPDIPFLLFWIGLCLYVMLSQPFH